MGIMILDKPEKTARLITILKAAVPFEIKLPTKTLDRLRAHNPNIIINSSETVFQVSYEPDHGGILCLIRTAGSDDLVATSLTNIYVHASQPFAAAVKDYQKHRRKKLRQRPALSNPVTATIG